MRAAIFLLHKGQKCLLLLSSFISAKKTSFYGVCGFEPLNRSKKMVCFDTKYHLILIYTVTCNNSFHFKSLVTNNWMIWMKIGILKSTKAYSTLISNISIIQFANKIQFFTSLFRNENFLFSFSERNFWIKSDEAVSLHEMVPLTHQLYL